MSKINLGDKVEDLVTGFTGIAVARTSWIHGCDRIVIQPQGLDKDGKSFANECFDEMQVTVIKEKAVPSSPRGNTKAPGGPRDDRAATKQKS